MREWLEGLAGPEYAVALMWVLAALVLLAIVLIAVRLIRSLTFGTFVAGGRNRKTRLAVMDATAVDSHRRLVLVRRDDVEHLLLIGGPTDVVVEQDIRLHSHQRRPAHPAEPAHEPAPLRATERSRPSEVPQTPAPPRPEPARTLPTAHIVQQHRAAERPGPQLVRPLPEPERALPPPTLRPVLATPAAPNPPPQLHAAQQNSAAASHNNNAAAPQSTIAVPQNTIATPPKPRLRDNIDDALIDELQHVDNGEAKKPAKPELSLEDEMTKLLGELSSHKR